MKKNNKNDGLKEGIIAILAAIATMAVIIIGSIVVMSLAQANEVEDNKRFVKIYEQENPRVYVIEDKLTHKEFVIVKVKELNERLVW